MSDESRDVSFLEALKTRYGAEDDVHQYDPSAFLVSDAKRRKNKTWELVGMEKTRQKQSHYDKLVHVVLRNLGITVAVKDSERQGGSDDLTDAHMARLQELDISENILLPLSEIGHLIGYFPALEILQVSDSPTLLQGHQPSAQPPSSLRTSPPALASSHITKLVFNNVGFRSLFQLRSLIDLLHLVELHLDNNQLDTFNLYAGPAEEALASSLRRQDGSEGEWLCFPYVITLSLAHNRIASWGIESGLACAIAAAFPKLTRLFLTDNRLPNLTLPESVADAAAAGAVGEEGEKDSAAVNGDEREALLAPYAFLRPLELLCLNDNAAITDPRTLDAVRVLCPALSVFRITYETLLPTWNETLSRMYVVASLPTITLLNRGQVRPKERFDSEVFYLQRALAQLERGADKAADAAPAGAGADPAYPLLETLREKYKDLVLSIYKEGATASSDGSGSGGFAHMMLSVTLHCENHYKSAASPGTGEAAHAIQKQLPSNLTIGKLKALVKMTFQVDPFHQELSYLTGDAGVLQRPIALENEQETLSYYGVCSGATIRIRDTSVR